MCHKAGPRRLTTHETPMPVVPLRSTSVTCFVAICTLYVGGGHTHEVGLTGPHTSAKSSFLTWGEQRIARGDRRSARDVAGAVPQDAVPLPTSPRLPPALIPHDASTPRPRGLVVRVALQRRHLLMGGLGRLGAG